MIKTHIITLNWASDRLNQGALEKELSSLESSGAEIINVVPLEYESAFGGMNKIRKLLVVTVKE